MDKHQVLELLRAVQHGGLSPEEAVERLAVLPYEDLSFAKLDHHRAVRKGFPEVVFGEMKEPAQVQQIVEGLARGGAPVLVTRASEELGSAMQRSISQCRLQPGSSYHSDKWPGATTQGRSVGSYRGHQRRGGSRGGLGHGIDDGKPC